MQEAARTIVGIHEFSAFAVHRREDRSERPHRCAIREAEWEARLDGTGYTFRVAADRFLHHMVRFLVGTMVDIGLGRRPVEDMALLLTRPDNHETSPPAPPQGLYFVAAEYPRDCYVEPAE
jgi:tRNA pseudouridine38-40 synthase